MDGSTTEKLIVEVFLKEETIHYELIFNANAYFSFLCTYLLISLS